MSSVPDWSEALSLLGLDGEPDEATTRAAYRRRLRETHPDLNADRDATERTVLLTAAYRVVIDGPPPRSTPPTPVPEPVDVVPDPPGVHLVDAETIGIEAPAIDAVPLLIEAAHQLGEISYLDPAAGLLEVVVEFVGAPTSSVVLTLQGRATGVTEVFCSVEPLSGGEAPAADAVTQLLLRTLRGEDPTA